MPRSYFSICLVLLVFSSPVKANDDPFLALIESLEKAESVSEYERETRNTRRRILLGTTLVVVGLVIVGTIDANAGRIDLEEHIRATGIMAGFGWLTDFMASLPMELETREGQIVELKELMEERRAEGSLTHLERAEELLEDLRDKGFDVDRLSDKKYRAELRRIRRWKWSYRDKFRLMTYAGGCAPALEQLVRSWGW